MLSTYDSKLNFKTFHFNNLITAFKKFKNRETSQQFNFILYVNIYIYIKTVLRLQIAKTQVFEISNYQRLNATILTETF